MPRMLELFCGTGSFGAVFRQRGYTVVSLDTDVRWKPDICIDVLEWDYKAAYPVGYFNVITASPPCTEYSIALTTRPRNIDASNVVVQRTLDIIAYFQPTRWMMENPRTGLLKSQSVIQDIAFIDVDYCQFSDWGYRKATRIWGDASILDIPCRICDGNNCENLVPCDKMNALGTNDKMRQKRRKHRIQLGGDFRRTGVRNQVSRNKKYRVPAALIRYVMGFDVLSHSEIQCVKIPMVVDGENAMLHSIEV